MNLKIIGKISYNNLNDIMGKILFCIFKWYKHYFCMIILLEINAETMDKNALFWVNFKINKIRIKIKNICLKGSQLHHLKYTCTKFGVSSQIICSPTHTFYQYYRLKMHYLMFDELYQFMRSFQYFIELYSVNAKYSSIKY